MSTPSPRSRDSRGFTLIELMTVVVILGVLAAIAINAYAKQVRNAHKAEVIADLANITLREKNFLAVAGHYASTTDDETPYPTKTAVTAAGTGSNPAETQWVITDAGYTNASKVDSKFFRGGGAVHGFDAMGFMPEGGASYCGYGTVSGWGTNAPSPSNDAPDTSFVLGGAVFPASTTAPYTARDWFYAFAFCDFDHDSTYWAFTTTHYGSDVASSAIGAYKENE